MLRIACAVACRAVNVQWIPKSLSTVARPMNRILACQQSLASNFHTLTTRNPLALSTNPAIISLSNNHLLQHQQTRNVTKFSLQKGKRKSVGAVLKRFKRLDWGGWIRTRCGRHKKIWQKSAPLRKRLRQHVLVNATQSWLLDKMVSTRGLQTSAVNQNAILSDEFLKGLSKPESRTSCTLIPGDGVGPELMYSLQEVFKAANCPVDFETFFFSEVNPTMSARLEDVTASIKKNKICLKGILATPDFSRTGELQTLNMKLRTELDLYANVVHVRSLPGVKSRHHDIDCVIIREQTDGEYSALEHESIPGVVECLKIITAKKSARIAKFAFDYATKNQRKKVTCVHKANIMKLGDGLFLKSCEEISKLYPRIQFEKMIVDNTTMQLVSNPNQFDVMVTPNLYGSIVDNIACGLVGGAGVVAGASYSAETCVFEPGARHTFSEAVGKNLANPTAMLLCGAKLLRHVNLQSYSDMITNAINKVLMEGKFRTKDLGGQSTTTDFTYAVIDHLK